MQFDPNLLPNLGEPRADDPLSFLSPTARTLLKDRKVKGQLADIMYEIGLKNAKMETNYRDAFIKAMLGYNGDASLNVTAPLFGGNIDFNANRNNGSNSFGLQFRRSF